MKIQPQKLSLQLIRFAKSCQNKEQGQSPEERTRLENSASPGSFSGIQRGKLSFSPQFIFIAEIVEKCQKGDSYIKPRMKKFKFLPQLRELFPFPITLALEHIPVHEDQVSKSLQGSGRKNMQLHC